MIFAVKLITVVKFFCVHCGQREGVGEAAVRSTRQFGKYYLNAEENSVLFSPPSREYFSDWVFEDSKPYVGVGCMCFHYVRETAHTEFCTHVRCRSDMCEELCIYRILCICEKKECIFFRLE